MLSRFIGVLGLLCFTSGSRHDLYMQYKCAVVKWIWQKSFHVAHHTKRVFLCHTRFCIRWVVQIRINVFTWLERSPPNFQRNFTLGKCEKLTLWNGPKMRARCSTNRRAWAAQALLHCNGRVSADRPGCEGRFPPLGLLPYKAPYGLESPAVPLPCRLLPGHGS